MAGPLRYRLCATLDPEERLEDAALWKALHDEWGDAIEAIHEGGDTPVEGLAFGRGRRFQKQLPNPVPLYLPYWEDQAFLAEVQRAFAVHPYEEVQTAVARLHSAGKGAFVKSTVQKQAIFRIPVERIPETEIGDMAYSFMDGGPPLLVQELCNVSFEYRFFCVGREIITASPVQELLTPIDHPLPAGTLYRTPRAKVAEVDQGVVTALEQIAMRIGRAMVYPHAVIDCALINGKAGAIEMNPMRLGETGLFACDVRALAKASRQLVARDAA